MRTKTAFLMLFLIAGALIASVSIRSVWSNPGVLYVPSQYPTIQSALLDAVTGDTIMVSAGTYNEHDLIVATDGITIQGESRTNTIIDAQNSNQRIFTVNADNVVIRGFTIKNAGTAYGAFGVFLNHSTNADLANNAFLGCYFSVRAENSTNVTVSSSSFAQDTGGGSAGVYTLDSQMGLVVNNTFNAMHVGVFLEKVTTGFVVRNNTFTASILTGITVAYSTNNSILRNTYIDNNSSISIKYEGANMVIGNTISNSQTAGILLLASSNNVIHHNNFVNNDQQVRFLDSAPPVNIWSSPGIFAEGNYWSDYMGMDLDRNGIGDSQRIIAANNTDPFPLIGPFREYSVTYQSVNYNVYAISNSIISSFSFNPAAGQINFQVSDSSDTLGICRVVFPTAILAPQYSVFVNGANQAINPIYNGTHVALYFSYAHTGQPSDVLIVPEFPFVIVVAFLLTLTALAAVLRRKTKD